MYYCAGKTNKEVLEASIKNFIEKPLNSQFLRKTYEFKVMELSYCIKANKNECMVKSLESTQ